MVVSQLFQSGKGGAVWKGGGQIFLPEGGEWGGREGDSTISIKGNCKENNENKGLRRDAIFCPGDTGLNEEKVGGNATFVTIKTEVMLFRVGGWGGKIHSIERSSWGPVLLRTTNGRGNIWGSR